MKKTTLSFGSVLGATNTISKTVTLLVFMCLGINTQALAQTCSMKCLGIGAGGYATQISVDEDCMAMIAAADMLIGEDIDCPNGEFKVIVTDPATGDTVAMGDPAIIPYGIDLKIYDVEIRDTSAAGSLNYCWTKVLLEDKLGPTIECLDTVVNCFSLPSYLPMAFDNCDPNPIIETIGRDNKIDTCDERLLYIIQRRWAAFDQHGTSSDTCIQTIEVERLDPDDIDNPPAIVELECDAPYLRTSLGGVDDAPHPSVTGEPEIDGVGLWSTSLPHCNLIVGFTDRDVPLPSCHGGVKRKILRTWEITEWFCDGSDTTSTIAQRFEIIDTVPPVLTCPDDMTFNTSAHSCDAVVVLPPIDAVDNCCPVTDYAVEYPGGVLATNGGVIELSAGHHEIKYFASDECGNEDSCSVWITVADLSPPDVVCNSHLTTAVTTTGYSKIFAESFDDGSTDNCSDVYFKVRRMTIDGCDGINGDDDLSRGGYQEYFDDYAKFCCADIGSDPVMVILRVYDVDPGDGPINTTRHLPGGDLYGRYNECMVEVIVQDKLPPEVICPPDIYVSCEFDFDVTQLGTYFGTVVEEGMTRNEIAIVDPALNGDNIPYVWGIDGVASDNCNVSITENPPLFDTVDCGYGQIYRSWTVEDDGNRIATCTQIIHIINTSPFEPLPNAFPPDVTVNECDPANLDPGPITGDVDISNDNECSNVLVDYEDRIYEIVPGACFKIERSWTIIDWCQFDGRSGYGRWDYTQFIKVKNSLGPVFDAGSCTPPDPVCSHDPNCGPAQVDLMVSATDDCTPLADIVYDYHIDLDNDGVYDIGPIQSNDASGLYDVGTHKITWTAEDLCGNKTSCSYLFTVESCTQPLMKCKNVIIVLDDNGSVELWANDIDDGSAHPCPNVPISLSFSPSSVVSNMTFTCDDLGDNTVMLWGIDPYGNTDFCEVNVEVQDNSRDACPDPNPLVADINGIVSTEEDQPVENTEVKLIGSSSVDMTDAVGQYAFEDMLKGGAYTVQPYNNANPAQDITTLDLIQIQGHILGVSTIDSPYDLIAADADNSGQIDVLDLLELQSLILGLTPEFTNNTSWRFVDRTYQFVDPTKPLAEAFTESYDIPALNSNMDIDFIGIKVGDVNGSYRADLNGHGVQSRSAIQVTAEEAMLSADQHVAIPFVVNREIDLMGMQFSLGYDASAIEIEAISSDLLTISDQNINVDNDVVHLSAFDRQGQHISEGQTLFTVYVKAHRSVHISHAIQAISSGLAAEAYDADINTYALAIHVKGVTEVQSFAVYQNRPNPVEQFTAIGFDMPTDDQVRLSLFDMSGKLIYTEMNNYTAGYHEIVLDRQNIAGNGVMYYQLATSAHTATKKMVWID